MQYRWIHSKDKRTYRFNIPTTLEGLLDKIEHTVQINELKKKNI